MNPTATQPTTSADALSQLQTAQGSAKGANDFVSEQNKALGVDQAQQQVSGLRQAITNTTNLLNSVAPSVMGRTGNSLVTSAQAGRQIQNEQAPLNTTLGQQNQDYTAANSDLTSLSGKASALASGEYQSQQDKLANYQNIYNALYKQEQDSLAQQTEQQKLAEQAREANLTAGSNSGIGSALSSLLGGGSNTPSSTDPIQQLAYNDVYTRIQNQNADQIKSDYLATLKSANYGNAKDKAKIALYNQLGYNFAAPTNSAALNNIKGGAQSINLSSGGFSTPTKATPQKSSPALTTKKI